MAGIFEDVAAEIGQERQEAARGNPMTFTPPADPNQLAAASVPAPAPAGGFMADVAAEIGQERNQRLVQGLEMASQADPERYAKAKAIGDRYGIDPLQAMPNLADLEKRDAYTQIRSTLEENQALREWFLQGDNPHLVKASELSQLATLPWLFKAPAAAWADGRRQVELSDLYFKKIDGTATPDDLARIAGLEAEDKTASGAADDYGAEWRIGKGVAWAAQNLPNMWEAFKAGATGAAVGGAVGGLAGAAIGGGGAAPGAVFGATWGSRAGVFYRTMQMEAGNALQEFEGMRDQQGNALDPAVAKGAAMLVGIVNGGLETVGLESVAHIAGGGMLVRQAVKEAMTRPTFQTALVALGKDIAKGVATEGTTEMLQEVSTIMGGLLAQQQQGGQWDNPTAGEQLFRVLKAGEQAAFSTLVMGPALGGPRLIQDLGRAKRAQQQEDFFRALSTHAQDNELVQRLPSAARDAVAALTKDGGIDTVYLPADKATELFQSIGMTPLDLDQLYEGFGAKVQEAIKTGGDVEIPMADWYSKFAGTKVGEQLVGDLRLHPGEMTANEARDFNEAWQAAREQMLQELSDQAQAERAKAAPSDQVFEQVKEQAIAAGIAPDQARLYGTLYSRFFTIMGERTKTDPLELLGRYGLEIKRALPEELATTKVDALDLAIDALRQGKGKALDTARRQALGPSLMEWIKSRGGIVGDDGGELAARDLGHLVAKPDQAGRVWVGSGANRRVNAASALRLDATAQAATEAGYLRAEDVDGRASIDDLLAAIDNELGGRKVYADGLSESTVELPAHLQALDNLERVLGELGLVPSQHSNEEIRRELARVTNPSPDQDALFQLAGINARTFNPAMRDQAEAMEAAGADNDAIWEATGMWRGPDGLWRFEISDRDATLDQTQFEQVLDGSQATKASNGWDQVEGDKPSLYFEGGLADVLQHPHLFDAYPSLAGVKVKLTFGVGKGGYHQGAVQDTAAGPKPATSHEYIVATGRDWNELLSVLLHEIQHAIQMREGFAPGGNMSSGELYEGETVQAWQREIDRLQIQLDNQRQVIEATLKDRAVTQEEKDQALNDYLAWAAKWQEERNEAGVNLARAAQFEYYRRISGEAEARNVQTRHKIEVDKLLDGDTMPPDTPHWTQDVPTHKQIVLTAYVPGGMSESLHQAMEPAGQVEAAAVSASDQAGGKYARTSLQSLIEATRAKTAARQALAQELADAGKPVRLVNKAGLKALVGPDMSRGEGWRATFLDGEGPSGHREFATALEALNATMADGYLPEGRELFQAAWHGSPHLFEKFRTDAIGTGEGAQAFGWGLYFAGRRELAEYYRSKLAGEQRVLSTKLGGVDLATMAFNGREEQALRQEFAKTLDLALPEGFGEWSRDDATVLKGMRAIAPHSLQTVLYSLMDKMGNPAVKVDQALEAVRQEIVQRSKQSTMFTEADRLSFATAAAVAEALKGKIEEPAKPGRLFKVEVPDNDKLADWDKGANEQPPGIKEKVATAIWSLAEAQQDPDTFENVREIAGSWLTGHYTLEDVIRALAGDELGRRGGLEDYAVELPARDVSLALNAAGVPGHRFLDGASRRAGEGSHNFVIYDDQAVQVLEYFQNGPGKAQDLGGNRADKRGSIQLYGDRTVINLFAAADLSTFLHESGHFFLEVLKDLATAEGAHPDLVADWERTKAYLGIGADNVIPVEAHEKWARSFEGYLMEGNPPAPELAGMFARFKAWLTFVYQNIKRLGVALTPEIRGVMDRMLASDQEIEAAQRLEEYRPLFADAAAAGMNEAEFADYQAAAAEARDQAKAALTARMIRQTKRALSEEWKAEKAQVREEVMRELMHDPVYQAMHWLRTGEVLGDVDPDQVIRMPEGRVRLDRDELLRMFGPTVLGRLPKAVPPIYGKGGIHPDVVAEFFGLGSGVELVEGLLSKPSLSRQLVAETEQRMRERHGDLLANQDQRTEAALDALHNEKRGELLAAELDALHKRLGKGKAPSAAEIARRSAFDAISSRRIGDVRPSIYQAAERKAAREAERALLAGDFQAAAAAKQRQLYAHAMAMEAGRATAEVERTVDYLAKFVGRKPPKAVAPDYLEQIRGLLERFDLAPASERTIAKRKSLAEFVQEAEDRGEVVAIPEPLLNEAMQVHYKDLSVDDLRGLSDAVRNLDHLGRLKRKLVANRERINFEAARDELVGAARKNLSERRGIKGRNPTRFERFKETGYGLVAELLRGEQAVDWLDGGDVNGPWRRLIWERLSKAQADENDLLGEYAVKVREAFNGVPGERLRERVTIPGVGTLTREEMLAIALNTGTESNLDKLLRGDAQLPDGKPKVDSQGKLDAVLGHLSKEDWQVVQNVWDTINGLWPRIAAVQKRVAGIEPPKVEARSFTNQHGTWRGGYYPLVYDPRYAWDVQVRNDASGDKLFDNTYVRPATEHGFTIARTKYARPLATSLDVIGDHLAKVIHDVTHREAVRDTYKLLADPAVRQAVEETLGRPVYVEMGKMLKRVANDQARPTGATTWTRAIMKARTNVGIYAMGYRLSTIVAQFGGFSNSLEMVGARHLGAALIEFMRDPVGNGVTNNGELAQFVAEKSGEMRHRMETIDRDVRYGLAQLQGKGGLLAQVQRSAFMGVGMADRVVTIPTWLAGYNQHLAENPGDEVGAIANGDRVVRMTQGAGGAKDISSIMQKNEFMSWTTMFYSYFNVYFNRMWALGKDTGVAIQERNAAAIPSLVARAIYLSILPAVLGDLLTAKGPDDKDEEEKGAAKAWAMWAGKKMLLYPLQSVPGLRDIGGALDNGMDYQVSPLARIGKLFVDMAKQAEKGGEANPRRATKIALDLVGSAAGIPMGQLVTTGNNIWKGMDEGDFRVRELFFSRDRK